MKALRMPRPKTNITTAASPVSMAFSLSRYTPASAAVTRLPKKSIIPVPTRFRTPSTSFMILEVSWPVLFVSKKEIDKRLTCA